MKDIAIKLLKEIESFGYEAYIVGGFVRDHYFSRHATDIDIVTNAPLAMLSPYVVGDLSKNKRGFDVIIVEYEGYKFEVASFRGNSIYDDLKRRDFNIDSLAMCSDGVLIVPDDFDSSILKIGGAGEELFEEDPLRVLRGVRMAVKYDLDIEEETFALMKKYAPFLAKIDMHRVYEEFMKGLSLDNWRKYTDLCYKVGIPFVLIERNTAGDNVSCVHSRFLYIMRYMNENEIEKFLRIPNDIKELFKFYRRCWKDVSYKPCDDYDIYDYIKRNREFYRLCYPVYEDLGDHDIILYCDYLLRKGMSKESRFVTGKDVISILALPNSPRVGSLIREANRLIMKTDRSLDKRDLLHRLNNII
jgi:hypothetical protein